MSIARNDLPNPARWALLLGLLVLGGILSATLTPMPYHRVPPEAPFWQGYRFIGTPAVTPRDIVSNVLLFIPVGGAFWMMMMAAVPRRTRFVTPASVVFAAMFSIGIEWTQVFIPGRYPSFVDICANSLGGLVGANLTAAAFGLIRAATLRLLRADCPSADAAATPPARRAA